MTASFDCRGLYYKTQASDRYGMEFKTRLIYLEIVVEKVAQQYNVLFALHLSRNSIYLPVLQSPSVINFQRILMLVSGTLNIAITKSPSSSLFTC
jgi:hypothetical protein